MWRFRYIAHVVTVLNVSTVRSSFENFTPCVVVVNDMCDHGHGGHGHGGACSSEVVAFDHGQEGMEYNMQAFIDKDKGGTVFGPSKKPAGTLVVVLNEAIDGTGVRVFKRWTEHLDRTDYVDSDVDEEILFNIPFTGHVKLTGLTLIGEMDDTHPSRLRIFKDRQNVGFQRSSTPLTLRFSDGLR